MDTKTFGSSGTYTDLNSWASYITGGSGPYSGGNLTDDITAACKSGGLTTSSQQIVSGWAPNGFSTTIKADTGASFRDNANVRTNALDYNTANGAFIASSYSGGGAGGAVSIRVDKSRVKDLQIKATGGYARALSFDTTSMGDVQVEGNILWATSEVDGTLYMSSVVDGTGVYVRNNLVKSERGAGGSKAFNCDGCKSSANKIKIHDNTFWNEQSNVCVGMGSDTYAEIIGNAFLNISGNTAFGCRDAQCSGSNNATNRSAWDNTGYGAGTITGLTASQLSITIANEFIDADASETDFRLKTGGTALQDNGVAISGISDDISRFARASGSEDIGCWQKTTGGAAFTWQKMVNDNQPLPDARIAVAI